MLAAARAAGKGGPYRDPPWNKCVVGCTLDYMEFIRARLALVITVVSWASAYPAIRIAVVEYGPVALSVARLLVASVALALAAPLLGIRRPALRDIPLIAACGLTGMTLYQ